MARADIAAGFASWYSSPVMLAYGYEIPDPPRGEDLPYDDGEPMESARHRFQMELLIESLEMAWKDRDDFYAGGNMALYFSALQAKNQDFRAPDVFVVLDTTRRERKSWVVWEEDGKVPDVVIEITSPSTAAADRGKKKRIYERVLRLPFYAIFDPFEASLEGFELRGDLERVEPDADGRVFCKPLGLYLGVREGTFHGVTCSWLRWLDANGAVLPSDEEAALIERERAESEKARAESEKARAESEKARAESEKAPADAVQSGLKSDYGFDGSNSGRQNIPHIVEKNVDAMAKSVTVRRA